MPRAAMRIENSPYSLLLLNFFTRAKMRSFTAFTMSCLPPRYSVVWMEEWPSRNWICSCGTVLRVFFFHAACGISAGPALGCATHREASWSRSSFSLEGHVSVQTT
jgi:hypothetical protein